ncbi:MAG TPA: hypothetical protein VNA13_01640 [Xanthomonadales bacterium]|nr:hypothetical protein [Xanthomonadales bacterium]
MKEAGRSISVARSIGSVGTISRGPGSTERGASFSAAKIPTLSVGRSLGPTRAFTSKDYVFSNPLAEKTVGMLKPVSFSNVPTRVERPIAGIQSNVIREPSTGTSQPIERVGHNHRRRPARPSKPHIEAPKPEIEKIGPAKPSINRVGFLDLSRPREIMPIKAREKISDGEKAMRMLFVVSAKRKEITPVQEKQTIIPPPRVGNAERLKAKVELPILTQPEIKVAQPVLLPVPERLTASNRLIARKLMVSPGLRRVRTIDDEEKDQEERNKTFSTLVTETKKLIAIKSAERVNPAEVIVFTANMIEKKTESEHQVEEKKVEFEVDGDVNDKRLKAILAIKRVIEKMKLGKFANGKEVAGRFPMNQDPSLLSEIVRKKGKDGSLEALKAAIEKLQKINSLSAIKSLVRSTTAVRVRPKPEEHATKAEVKLVLLGDAASQTLTARTRQPVQQVSSQIRQ